MTNKCYLVIIVTRRQLFHNYAYIIAKVKFQFQWDKNYNCNMLKTFFNFSFL